MLPKITACKDLMNEKHKILDLNCGLLINIRQGRFYSFQAVISLRDCAGQKNPQGIKVFEFNSKDVSSPSY